MIATKKILFILILVVASIIFTQFIDVVFGASVGEEIKGEFLEPLKGSATNIKKASDVVGIVIIIVRWTYTIFFIIAVFMILLAAYTYLTAQAEPEKIKNATNQIIYAAIAIVVALLAVSINVIVKSIVEPSGGGGGGGVQSSPTYN